MSSSILATADDNGRSAFRSGKDSTSPSSSFGLEQHSDRQDDALPAGIMPSGRQCGLF
jgi:hypothetical protein